MVRRSLTGCPPGKNGFYHFQGKCRKGMTAGQDKEGTFYPKIRSCNQHQDTKNTKKKGYRKKESFSPEHFSVGCFDPVVEGNSNSVFLVSLVPLWSNSSFGSLVGKRLIVFLIPEPSSKRKHADIVPCEAGLRRVPRWFPESSGILSRSGSVVNESPLRDVA